MWVCNLDLDPRVSEMYEVCSEQRIDKPHMHVDCATVLMEKRETGGGFASSLGTGRGLIVKVIKL